MSAQAWFEACDQVLQQVRETQAEGIAAAAEMIAETMASGGALHFYDNGHCPGEPLGRAGGLFAIHPLSCSVNVSNPCPPKHAGKRSPKDYGAENARIAVERSNMFAGDCLLLISVTGRSAFTVELALRARERGVKVITIASLSYARFSEARHPSGKKVFEVADLVIDNCGIPGDAALEIEGIETKVAPTSGVAGCYIVWALTAELVKRLRGRGLKPSIYRSINMPDGETFNEQQRKHYEQRGI